MRSVPLRRWLLAVALGVGAAALNELYVRLLTQETPRFLLGGALVLIAFARLGEGPGLLAAVVALGHALSAGPPASLVFLVYVAEPWVAYRIYRRTSSLILGVTGFWFLLGWLFDALLYGTWIGLSRDYLALLLVKQLFNGLINATIAEATLCVGPVRRFLTRPAEVTRPTPLQAYSFHRVILAAVIPAVLLGLAYTRSEFFNEIATGQVRSGRTAEAASQGMRQYLGGIARTLQRAARQIERVDAEHSEMLARLLQRVRTAHSELLKSAVFDRDGKIVVSDPATDINGRSLVGLNLAGQDYFQELRRTHDTVYTPLFDPSIQVEGGAEHVMIMAEPLIDAQGSLAGGVVVALDPQALVPILQRHLSDPAEKVTVFDEAGRVIVSLDPQRPVGTRLYEALFDANGHPLGVRAVELLQGPAGQFVYYPPHDGSVESRLHLNPNYATVQLVVVSGWRVLVDLPAHELLQMIVPTAYAVVGIVFFTIIVLYLVVLLLTRRISEPIATVNRIAAHVVGGQLVSNPGLEALAQSPVVEFRELAGNITAMQQALVAKRALSAAREQASRERFRATFDQAAVGIAHTTLDGTILRINEKFCEMLGRPRQQLLGSNFQDYSPGHDREVEKLRTTQMPNGQPRMFTLEKRLAAGMRQIWVQLTVSLIRTGSGEPSYCMVVAQDITDRKVLEEQFLQSQKMEGIGLLAGGIAHDFNNLLTPILGYAGLAQDQADEGSELQEALQQIHLAANRAKQLTWQLLAFSRKQVLKFETVNLSEAVAGFEDMIRMLLREDIELVIETEPEAGHVRADRAQVQQLLMNLAANAQDSMPEGGRLTIRVASTEVSTQLAGRHPDVPEGPAVLLSVCDTGTGISPSLLPRIFEPFFTTKDPGKGTGLGLATVYGIAKQHGGGVVVESEPGKGSTFHVYLPAVQEQGVAAEPSAEPRAAPTPTATPRQAKGRVLVVEDEKSVRRFVGYALRNQGYEVLEAPDAEQAIALAQRAPRIDLLLTDVVLPGMNGRELATQIGSPELKVIFMSGYARQVLSADGALQSGTHLLPKPFSMQALTDKVREILEAEA